MKGALLICLLVSGQSPDTAEVAAEKIVAEAIQAYRSERFADAAELFLSAYRQSKRPAQLRNAAKAFEQAGLGERALTHWREYLWLAGLNEEKRDFARTRIRTLESEHEAEVQRTRAEALRAKLSRLEHGESAAEVPTDAPVQWRWWLIGGGAAAVAAGAGLYGSAWKTYRDFKSDQPATVTRAQASAARVRGGVAWATAGVGVGAILAGVLLPFFDEPEDQVAVVPVERGALVLLKTSL